VGGREVGWRGGACGEISRCMGASG
jgi:hypothetical protein